MTKTVRNGFKVDQDGETTIVSFRGLNAMTPTALQPFAPAIEATIYATPESGTGYEGGGGIDFRLTRTVFPAAEVYRDVVRSDGSGYTAIGPTAAASRLGPSGLLLGESSETKGHI